MNKIKISAVYQIVNTVTNDRYVGSSKNVFHRWACHKIPSTWKQHPNNPMYKDFQKYGLDKFRFQILASVEPGYLKQVEQEFIEMLNPTYNDRRSKGWNVGRIRETSRKALKKYYNRLCLYNGEELTMGALKARFRKDGVEHPTLEAKKYLIEQ